MTKSKRTFQEKKNRETENALQKILRSLTTRQAKARRFSLWPTRNGVGISMEIDYETQDTPKENTK